MLSKDLCKEALLRALSTGADYAEVFAEYTRSKNISAEDKINGNRNKIND